MGQRFRQGFKNNREVHFLKRGNIVVLVDSCSVYFPWYQAPKSKIGSGCPVELYLQMGCRRLFKDKKKKSTQKIKQLMTFTTSGGKLRINLTLTVL
jgi:hypothetical protein